ncbi:type ISP restriction/modification enzyme [candidate division KSB1 bacterium]
MSIHAINKYYAEVEEIVRFGGSRNEMAIRTAFYKLLDEYARQKDLRLIPELSVKSRFGKSVTPDGTLKDSYRQDWGYWESKDESDIIDDEIDKKFTKGYPNDNILFEDSQTAVLFQNAREAQRVVMSEPESLNAIITAFISYERPEVSTFRKAIELFKKDIPDITDMLRDIIVTQEKTNNEFSEARDTFLELCQKSINPNIVNEDIREMMIQHILTEDIFNTIFDETQFHRENNIARELESVIQTFFTGQIRRKALSSVQHYYKTINAAAAGIVDHHEKQKFLKIVYETFYKSYNPKAADRLGVIYTPNEIVKFMIESSDYLIHKHFGKFLEDPGVEILDPAAGTGTFICDIIDHIRAEKLEYKYENEIHANEVAILPYYIANLNIEYTYAQKTGRYNEFKNLCFVDTLDNLGFEFADKQFDAFGTLSEENFRRIAKQNERKISVIIGNPPYNANQLNENENNKNRKYPFIDKRIKTTFIVNSNAQKTKMYDMYARFYRWAFDRIDNDGIIAFITNRSFIDSRTFDGFRKTVQNDFDYAYIIDTKSDVRMNPKIAGTTHNVFGIQTGVAIMFLIKKQEKDNQDCSIHYKTMDDFWRKEEKLQWLSENTLSKISFEHIIPDKKNNWINLVDNDFDDLLPLIDKNVKLGKSKNAVFKLFSLGNVSARDDWVYDFDEKKLISKIEYFLGIYNSEVLDLSSKANKDNISDLVSNKIKYTRDLKKDLLKGMTYNLDDNEMRLCHYRVFTKVNLYYAAELNEMRYQTPKIFPHKSTENSMIAINQGNKPFNVLVSKYLVDYHFNGDSNCLPFYRYDENGNRIENITDWGLRQFREHYKNKEIGKENIFHYVYGVLHDPAYRKKYELNLKREFPRIPFYYNFEKWRDWGKTLMDLHLNYETVTPFPLKETIDYEVDNPKTKLKADKEDGIIIVDEATTLYGIPKEAWEYKLGNRSAVEWILDQYKEKKPKDSTVADKFNTYRFADYKDKVNDLLKRVCTVSVDTMKIVREMEG